MKETTKEVKIISKPSISETLKAIPIGQTVLIKANKFKFNVVRNTVSKLNRTGIYNFVMTEKGLTDYSLVTRNPLSV
jgi:hypothetical protein